MSEAPVGDASRPNSGWRQAVPVIATGATVALLSIGAAWWPAASPKRDESVAPQPTRSDGIYGFVCGKMIEPSDPPTSDELCDRQADDYLKRREPEDSGNPRLRAEAERFTHIAGNLGLCVDPGEPTCSQVFDSHSPTDADVQAAEAALRQEHFRSFTVRLARRPDPAPDGALIYALRIDDACVVGYAERVPDGFGRHQILGALPSGNCLDE
jgi:hypothetical protein